MNTPLQLRTEEIIDKHIKPLVKEPKKADVEHFLKTGEISGMMYLALIDLIEDARK